MTNALKFTLLKNSIESLSTNDVTSNLLIDTYYYINHTLLEEQGKYSIFKS